MDPILPCLELGVACSEADLSVILMHGLGADGYDFAEVAEMLIRQAGAAAKWRFVLPHAPLMPVTLNSGMVMPAWYDIMDMSHPRNVDWETVDESARAVEALMKREQAGKIILAGFSQGGAMALHVGLHNQSGIAGILVMSGYLLESGTHPCPRKQVDFPIGLFHGAADTVVPWAAAERSVRVLREQKHTPELKTYPSLEHGVSQQEIQDVFTWLEEQCRRKSLPEAQN